MPGERLFAPQMSGAPAAVQNSSEGLAGWDHYSLDLVMSTRLNLILGTVTAVIRS